LRWRLLTSRSVRESESLRDRPGSESLRKGDQLRLFVIDWPRISVSKAKAAPLAGTSVWTKTPPPPCQRRHPAGSGLVGSRLRVPKLGLKAKKREPKNKPCRGLLVFDGAHGLTAARCADYAVSVFVSKPSSQKLSLVFLLIGSMPFFYYVRGWTWTNGAGAEQHAGRQCQRRRPAVTAPSTQQCHVDLDLSRLRARVTPGSLVFCPDLGFSRP
jgi:hypothetical protein